VIIWRGGVLALFAVHIATHMGVGAVHFVGTHEPWAHRAEGIKRLAHVPLHVLVLPIARRDVIDDGVTPYVLHRIGFGNAFAAFANDHRQLGFVINGG